MKEKIFNQIKDDIAYYFDEHLGVENPEWTTAPAESLRLPDSPTFDMYGHKHKVQITYWKQYQNIRDTIKQYLVKDRSVLVTATYPNRNDDEITRHLTVSFDENGDVIFDVVLKVNGPVVATYQKKYDSEIAMPENWQSYNAKGLRYRLIWELFIH